METFDFFGKIFVKLRRFKEFYCAKINSDLQFLDSSSVLAEEGEESELFGKSPSSDQAHFVNRIDEMAESICKQRRGKLEYSDDLKDGWPQADEAIDQVTAGFLKARYSEREITAAEAAEVQGYWKRLRAELKRRATDTDDE